MSGNGQTPGPDVEAALRAAAEAQVQEQLAQLRAAAVPAPVPVAQPYAGQAFAQSPPSSTTGPVAAPATAPGVPEDFEQLAHAAFLEFETNGGRSVFVDPSKVVRIEAHPTEPVCKLYSGGDVVTIHGAARDVAARLQLAADARRAYAEHLDAERVGALGAAIVQQLAHIARFDKETDA